MGNRTLIRNDKAIQVNIYEIIKNIEKILESVNPRLEALYKDIHVGSMAEINQVECRKVIAKTILNMSMAPVMLIPVAGQLVKGVLSITKGLTDTINNPLDINMCAAVVSITLDNVYRASASLANIDDSNKIIPKILAPLRTQPITRVGEYQSTPNIANAKDKQLVLKTLIYTEAKVEETIAQTLDDLRRHRLLPLLCWRMCANKQVEGHGTLLLNSTDLKTGNDLNEWISIQHARKLLGGKGNGHLAQIARKCRTSEFVREVNKEFCYKSYIGLNRYEITPIYIEKIRLISYRNRYKCHLYKFINTGFLDTVMRDRVKEYHEIFTADFYKPKLSIVEDCTTTNTLSTMSNKAHQYRRKIIYANYCFHQMLNSHLGTYFVSSLYAIGMSSIETDEKIALAFVDAYGTAWWAGSKAFEASRTVRLKESIPLQKLLIPKRTFNETPYIANYFNPSIILREHISLTSDAESNCILARHKIISRLKLLIAFVEKLSPYDMMPLNKNIESKIDRDSFNYVIKDRFIKIYKGILNAFEDDKRFLDIVKDAYTLALKNLDFKKYDSLLDNIDSKYDHFLNKSNIDNNFVNKLNKTKSSSHIRDKICSNMNLSISPTQTKLQEKLCEDIANLRMLNAMSIKKSYNAFDQHDFNTTVVKVLEKLIKHITPAENKDSELKN